MISAQERAKIPIPDNAPVSKSGRIIRCPNCGSYTKLGRVYSPKHGFYKLAEPRFRYCPECMWNSNPTIEPKSMKDKWSREDQIP